MNLTLRDVIPIISSNGMNIYSANDFYRESDLIYTHKENKSKINLLNELKKACLFSKEGVLTAFSNKNLFYQEELTIGRINIHKIARKFGKLAIIGVSNYRAIPGNIAKKEFVFPYIQYNDDNQINLTCCAFKECPEDFKPTYSGNIFLSLSSKEIAVKVLQKSLWEFSQHNTAMAIILLYASIEIAIDQLSNLRDGKISDKMRQIIHDTSNQEIKSSLKALKKKIETHIVKKRGEVAHKGCKLTMDDLLKSYQIALEFFWNYPSYRNLKPNRSKKQN